MPKRASARKLLDIRPAYSHSAAVLAGCCSSVVERVIGNDEVGSSILPSSTRHEIGDLPMTADAPSTPKAEFEIDAPLIRALLHDQQPQLALMDIEIIEAGWDNFMARIGPDLAIRLPRRTLAEPLLKNEQKWLSFLAPQLPIAIPVPLYCGTAALGYPFAWSLLKWLPGQAADLAPPDGDQAMALSGFLTILHNLPIPDGAPENAFRDCGLTAKNDDIELRMLALNDEPLLNDVILSAWKKAIAEPAALKSCWVAGDIHARNVLVSNGKISAFIDWGDMCIGDPASDLASIWALFADPKARLEVIEAYGMSDSLIIRALGWAIFYGVLLAETGRKDTPRHYKMGCDTLARISEDLQGSLKHLFPA
jgi:aminoglycoside phosphotransferase (APT) family kinase protein